MTAPHLAEMPPLMTLKEAAAFVPFSAEQLRQATNATDPKVFPPPLKAKKGPRGQRLIQSKHFLAWMDSLPDS